MNRVFAILSTLWLAMLFCTSCQQLSGSSESVETYPDEIEHSATITWSPSAEPGPPPAPDPTRPPPASIEDAARP